MNGHVLRRPFGNGLSSTVLTTGTALRPRQDTHDGTPALSWPVTKAVGTSDGSGRSSTMEAHAHRLCRHSLRAAARWRPMVMRLKPSRLAISAMVRPCWWRRIA